VGERAACGFERRNSGRAEVSPSNRVGSPDEVHQREDLEMVMGSALDMSAIGKDLPREAR
jgi:hypothetical protein